MTRPLPLSHFAQVAPRARAQVVDGLSATIDAVAAAAAESHRFLRYQWYAAALEAYGGQARTLLVHEDDRPVLAMPLVRQGPAWAKLAAVPGSYWPFRSVGLALEATPHAIDAALRALATEANAVRIGPVYDGDAGVSPLLAAARAGGWAVIDRFVADSWLFDMAEAARDGGWPRGSTLRKNRFHEKHLAAHGALDWSYLDDDDWPAGFAALGAVEDKSWIASRTDGRDAKFTQTGHLGFWRSAAGDPVLSAMFHAALLRIDGAPAAFSFDMDCGPTRYAVANSYDPAFAKHSPGKLLYYRNLVAAVSGGTTLVDWGAGDSGYKQVIGAARGPVIRDWLLVRPGLAARVARLFARAWSRSGQTRR